MVEVAALCSNERAWDRGLFPTEEEASMTLKGNGATGTIHRQWGIYIWHYLRSSVTRSATLSPPTGQLLVHRGISDHERPENSSIPPHVLFNNTKDIPVNLWTEQAGGKL